MIQYYLQQTKIDVVGIVNVACVCLCVWKVVHEFLSSHLWPHITSDKSPGEAVTSVCTRREDCTAEELERGLLEQEHWRAAKQHKPERL